MAAGSGVAFLEFYPRSVLGIRHLPPLEGGDSFVSREPSLDTPKYPNRILRGNLSPSESDGLMFLLGFDPSREHVEIIAASHCHEFHSVAIWAQGLRALFFICLLCCVGVMLTARAKAKARAKRASQVRQSNTRRDARFTAVRMLNTLAGR